MALKPIEQIDFGKLKLVINELNAKDYFTTKIKVIGVKKEDMVKDFVTKVNAMADADLTKATAEIIALGEVYDGLFTEDAAAAEGAAAEGAAAPAPAAEDAAAAEGAAAEGAAAPAPEKPKKEKKAKEPKAPKEPKVPKEKKPKAPTREKTKYGHVVGTQAGILDGLLEAGATMKDMEEKTSAKSTRIIDHIKHLRKDKGLTIPDPENKETGVYKVV